MKSRQRKLTYPTAVGPTAYRDVNGMDVSFTACKNPEVERDLFLAVAQSTLCNFQEIWNAMAVIVFPDAKIGGTLHAIPPKIKQLLDSKIAEAKQDEILLGLPLPLAEAVAVWQSCALRVRRSELSGRGTEDLLGRNANPWQRGEVMDPIRTWHWAQSYLYVTNGE